MTLPAVLLALFICGALPASAAAQMPIEPETWTVSPMGGFTFDPDADLSLTLGGALGYELRSNLRVEGDLSRIFDMAPDDADVDSTLTTFHAAVLYHFDREPMAPYIAGGVGFGHFSHSVTDPPASIRRTEVGFNVGGGATYPISGMLVRGDFRLFKHIDNVPTAWRFLAGVTIPLD